MSCIGSSVTCARVSVVAYQVVSLYSYIDRLVGVAEHGTNLRNPREFDITGVLEASKGDGGKRLSDVESDHVRCA